MKKVNYIVGAATVLLVLVLSSLGPRQQKGPPVYSVAGEVAVTGVVQDTKEFFCPVSDDQGMHLVLRTQQGDLLVHVAPARFLRGQGFRFNPQDQLSITGSRVHYQGQDALLAREITRGSEVLILRDSQGHPVWNR
jgi:hypothetical protein